ncbi:MAG: hypothetical protein ABI889_08400 [Gemmatimonadota bacterium]
MTRPASADSADEERRRIEDEIASRLRRKGVELTGKEGSEELADLEEAVEQFERMVERAGGDLMVDEPVSGGSPIAPDEPDFVLPSRKQSESVSAYIRRIHDAASRAGHKERP